MKKLIPPLVMGLLTVTFFVISWPKAQNHSSKTTPSPDDRAAPVNTSLDSRPRAAFAISPVPALLHSAIQTHPVHAHEASSLPFDSALEIAQDLHRCRMLIRDGSSALEHSLTGLASNTLQQATDAIADLENWCESLDNEQINSYPELLEYAASNGLVEAQLLYGILATEAFDLPDAIKDSEKIMNYKTKSITYWKLAAQAGNETALSHLSNAYEIGILTEADPVSSYAYHYAFLLATGKPTDSDALLNQMAASMTASQIETARNSGNSIHSSCCGR